MNYDVIVVGAGASGLVAAIAAAEKGSLVLIIEHKEKAGKKIFATGNGKCNFTNMYQAPECYRSNDSTFAMKVLSNFDNKDTIALFDKLGIYPKERNGYIYPNSEQAASIVSVLLMECKRLNIDIVYNEKVVEVTKPDFTLITKNPDNYSNSYRSNALILATGGCASPKLGSDGSGYLLAKVFGHKIIKPLPALVALKSTDKFCKKISGVRTIAKASIYADMELLMEDEGEIIFTDYGVSGIPIMQISRYASRSLFEGKTVTLRLDLFISSTLEELIELIMNRCYRSPDKTIEEMMVGMLNHKLNNILIKKAGLNPESPCHILSKSEIKKLSKLIKELPVNIKDTNSFDFAQVTSGGISTLEIDPNSMESKLKKGLYFSGELIDVDGACGGYNLQWAWSTGYIAGSNAGNTLV